MKKLLTVTALFALAVPAAFAVPPDGKGKPENAGPPSASTTQTSSQSPAKLCKEQLRTMGVVNFRSTYSPTGNGRNAMGKCVSQQQHVASQAASNAAKRCKAERASNPEAFKTKYGTNPNKANAFGKCVSQLAADKVEDQQDATLNAAKKCKAERQAIGVQAFADKYGTNPNKRNAFGKCVSQNTKKTS